MSTITLYTKPNCPQCDFTKRALAQKGINFESIDVTQDQASLDKVKNLGYSQLPVVVSGTHHWSGFRPDLINKTLIS